MGLKSTIDKGILPTFLKFLTYEIVVLHRKLKNNLYVLPGRELCNIQVYS